MSNTLSGAGAAAVSISSAAAVGEPVLAITLKILEICFKVNEAIHRVKNNSKLLEALQIRVTIIANLINRKQSAAQPITETEISTLKSLLQTLNETSEWMERREIKEATQTSLYQMFRSKDTMDKIKAFDDRLIKHMVDLNVELSVAIDLRLASACSEIQRHLQLLSESQKEFALVLGASENSFTWSLDSAVERLGRIEEQLEEVKITVKEGPNNVGAEVLGVGAGVQELQAMVKTQISQNGLILDAILQQQSPVAASLPAFLPQSPESSGGEEQNAEDDDTSAAPPAQEQSALPTDADGLVQLLKSDSVKNDPLEIARLTDALTNLSKSETGRQVCIFVGAPSVLTALAREKNVKENSEATRSVAEALLSLAVSESGRQACIASGAPSALTVLAREKAAKECSSSARYVAEALWAILETDAGKQACNSAGTVFALTALARERVVKENSSTAKFVSWALASIAEGNVGNKSCIDAGTISAIIALSREKAVRENSEAARRVAWALAKIAEMDPGRKACIDNGAPLALIDLGRMKSVMESGDAAKNVAFAISNMSEIEAGKNICITAGAPLLLADFARERAVRGNSEAAHTISLAIWAIAENRTGRQACISAGVPFVFSAWARENAVKENRLAAACLSASLEVIADIPAGNQACIAAGAPSALIELGRETVVKEDSAAVTPIVSALLKFSTIENGLLACIDANAPSMLVSLLQERTIKESSKSVQKIAEALEKMASNNLGKQACIDAGAQSALISLSREKAVKDDYSASTYVAYAIKAITGRDLQALVLTDDAAKLVRLLNAAGRVTINTIEIIRVSKELEKIAFNVTGKQVCKDVGAPSALISLARERIVKESLDALRAVASAYKAITDKDIDKVILVEDVTQLLNITRLETIKSNVTEIVRVSLRLRNIAKDDLGRKVCIDEGAPSTLTNLLRERVVRENILAAASVVAALQDIVKGSSAKLACSVSGLLSALTCAAYLKLATEDFYVQSGIVGVILEIAESNDGRKACLEAGVPFALIRLASNDAIKQSSISAKNVALVIQRIAESSLAVQAFVVAGAPSALTALARAKAVKENDDAAKYVAGALKKIASTDAGKQACIDVDVASALVALSREAAVKRNNSADTSVSETFKLITGKSIELAVIEEDIFGFVKQARSYEVKRSAIEVIRVAEGLEKKAKNPSSPFNTQRYCIDVGAPSALISLARERIVNESLDALRAVASAYKAITDKDIDKAILVEDVTQILQLVRSESFRSNSAEIVRVSDLLRNIAKDDLGRKVCIDEGVHFALTQLARETVTRNDSTTVIWVVAAILTLAASEEGRNGCIYAGVPLALTELAFETSVKNNCDAAIVVAGALLTLSRSESGKKACIDAGSPEALNVLAHENAVRAHIEAGKRVYDAYNSITGSYIVVPILVNPRSSGVSFDSTTTTSPQTAASQTIASTTMPVFGGAPNAVSFGAGSVPVSFSSHSQPFVGATSSFPNYQDDERMLMTYGFASLDVSAEENRWSVQSTTTTGTASNTSTTFAAPVNYQDDERMLMTYGFASLDVSVEENRWSVQSTITTVPASTTSTTFAESADPSHVNLTSVTINTPLQQESNNTSRASVRLLSISVNNKAGGGKLGAKVEEERHLFSTAKVKSVDESGLLFAKGVRAGLFFVSVDGEDVSKLSFKDVQAKVVAANKRINEGETISFSFTDNPNQDPYAKDSNSKANTDENENHDDACDDEEEDEDEKDDKKDDDDVDPLLEDKKATDDETNRISNATSLWAQAAQCGNNPGWHCSVCLSKSPFGSSKCLACEAINPNAPTPTTTAEAPTQGDAFVFAGVLSNTFGFGFGPAKPTKPSPSAIPAFGLITGDPPPPYPWARPNEGMSPKLFGNGSFRFGAGTCTQPQTSVFGFGGGGSKSSKSSKRSNLAQSKGTSAFGGRASVGPVLSFGGDGTGAVSLPTFTFSSSVGATQASTSAVSTSAQKFKFSSSADAAKSASTTASTSTSAPKFDFSNPAGATQSAAPTATTLLPQTFRFGGIGASSLPIPTQSTDVPFSFSNNAATASAAARLSFGDGVVSSTPTFHFPLPIIPPSQASKSTHGSETIRFETSYRQSEMWRAINAIIDTPDTTTSPTTSSSSASSSASAAAAASAAATTTTTATASHSSSSFGLQGFGQTSERPQAPTYTYCSRCGRSSHTRSSCYASYHADGYRLYF